MAQRTSELCLSVTSPVAEAVVGSCVAPSETEEITVRGGRCRSKLKAGIEKVYFYFVFPPQTI